MTTRSPRAVLCTICRTDDAAFLYRPRLSPGPVVRCRRCGLVYVSPVEHVERLADGTTNEVTGQLIDAAETPEYRALYLAEAAVKQQALCRDPRSARAHRLDTPGSCSTSAATWDSFFRRRLPAAGRGGVSSRTGTRGPTRRQRSASTSAGARSPRARSRRGPSTRSRCCRCSSTCPIRGRRSPTSARCCGRAACSSWRSRTSTAGPCGCSAPASALCQAPLHVLRPAHAVAAARRERIRCAVGELSHASDQPAAVRLGTAVLAPRPASAGWSRVGVTAAARPGPAAELRRSALDLRPSHRGGSGLTCASFT